MSSELYRAVLSAKGFPVTGSAACLQAAVRYAFLLKP